MDAKIRMTIRTLAATAREKANVLGDEAVEDIVQLKAVATALAEFWDVDVDVDALFSA